MPTTELVLNGEPLYKWNEPGSFVRKTRPTVFLGRLQVMLFMMLFTLLIIAWIIGVMLHPGSDNFFRFCVTVACSFAFVYLISLFAYYSNSRIYLHSKYMLIDQGFYRSCLPLKNIRNFTFHIDNGLNVLTVSLIENERFSCFVPSAHYQSVIEETILSCGHAYPLSNEAESSVIKKSIRAGEKITAYKTTLNKVSTVIIFTGLICVAEVCCISFLFFRIDRFGVLLNDVSTIALLWVTVVIGNRVMRNAAINCGLKCPTCKKLAISNNGLDINIIASKALCCSYCGEDLYELYAPTGSNRANKGNGNRDKTETGTGTIKILKNLPACQKPFEATTYLRSSPSCFF